MKAIFLAVVFVLLAVVGPMAPVPTSEARQNWSGIYQQTAGRYVALDGNNGPFCTAVVINREARYLLTASHCVDITNTTVRGQRVRLMKRDSTRDLAVLQANALPGNAKAIQLRRAPIEIGLPVAIVGYAFGEERPKFSFGWVSDYPWIGSMKGRTQKLEFQLDATVIPGHSGGPIVDPDGRLVSMTQGWVEVRGHGLTYGPAPQTIARFIAPYL